MAHVQPNLSPVQDPESQLNLNLLHQQISQLDLDDPIPEDKDALQQMIQRYIRLIRVDCADEKTKRELIVRLCELRIKLNALNEEEDIKYVRGHYFVESQTITTTSSFNCGTRTCEICMKRSKSLLIAPLLMSTSTSNPILSCSFCCYTVHQLCSSNLEKLRKCPRLLFEQAQLAPGCSDATENPMVKLNICPEKGLDSQNYKCADCGQSILFENSLICDYDGLYYCRNCHCSDLSVIPARVVHNWDFEPKPVSRRSLLMINYVLNRPVLFDILALNQMLYGFVDELSIIKRIRYELHLMSKYIKLCKQPQKPKLTIAKHLVEEPQINAYSIKELMDLVSLRRDLLQFQCELFEHITKACVSCKGNGFYCELCSDKADLLFPFSPNISLCPKCSAVYHKNCFYRKKICPRCQRLEQKVKILTQPSSASEAEEVKELLETESNLNEFSSDLQVISNELEENQSTQQSTSAAFFISKDDA